jgi:dihydropteroate synthase
MWGESTRPAQTGSVEEELRRVIPVIAKLRATTAMISTDTRKPRCVRGTRGGAVILNDVTGGRGDPKCRSRLRKAAIILMHAGTPHTMQVAPHYDDVVSEVADFFDKNMRALRCGIDAMAIAFDPNWFRQNACAQSRALEKPPRLRLHDRPLVVGFAKIVSWQ